MRKAIVLFVALMLPAFAFAQTGSVMGTVTDEAGNPLASAQVQIMGTTMGAATDLAGDFVIFNVPVGDYTLRCSFLGYKNVTQEISVTSGGQLTVDLVLSPGFIAQKELTFFASRATERLTPVAFTDVDKAELQTRLGSRDLPMVLNSTPSVYASESGGGPGDARINIRGFNQRNIAVMINGVPVNDMENGSVYWSNWDGLADVTSSIQVQRGLSAVNMAVPSVGGTMNVLTDAASMNAGIQSKTEVGAGSFLKETLSYNSGLINEKFAVSLSGVRKVSDGVIDNTYSDAWAYFLGASYIINDNNKLDLHFFGAPQIHGQRTSSQKVGTFSKSYAEDFGMSASYLDGITERGREYNANWGPISSQYLDLANKDYYWGSEHDARFDDTMTERENFYHKPQGNLNYYLKLNEKMNLTTVAYLSIGNGGGSGNFSNYRYASFRGNPAGTINWDDTIQRNLDATQEGATPDTVMIMRNSVNNHFWYGVIPKFDWKVNDNLHTQFGFDLRWFKGDHYREIRNLLGLDYYLDSGIQKGLGDKIAYDFTNTVTWYGGFAQAEYVMGDLSFVGMAGVTSVAYKHENFYGSLNGITVEPDPILGYQVKGGANYNVNEMVNVYGNVGYQSKAPIFDGVIDDGSGAYNEDPTNEKIIGFELGSGYNSLDRKLRADVNLYYTIWNDRTWNKSYTYEDPVTEAETDYLYTLEGVDAIHSGIEIELAYQVHRMLDVNVMASIGNWIWANDVTGSFRPDEDPTDVQETFIYIDGLHVGNQPQSSYMLGGTFMPVKGSYLNLTYRFIDRFYADFDPTDRDDPTDTAEAWKVPAYYTFDLHAGYSFANPWNLGISLGLDVFNLLDGEYYIEAFDGSGHNAGTSKVFMSIPRRWNVSLTLTY